MAPRDLDGLVARSNSREGGRPGDTNQILVWEGVPAGEEGASTYLTVEGESRRRGVGGS